jgi:copper chaperone CopZ
MSTQFAIEGMTCGGCRNRVAAALEAFAPGSTVTLEPPRASFPSSVDPEAANAALAAIGKYRLSEAVSPTVSADAPALIQATALPELPNVTLATYYPLMLIAAYVSIVSLAGTGMISGAHAGHETPFMAWMTNFMAGFFIVFSFFKLLDLRGFADAYSTYDLLAERWRGYGFIYPVLELGLGLAFLFRIMPDAANWATILLMGFSSLGVIRALMRRQTIRCACLGTALNLPMSTVTLVEDVLMIAMAMVMLAM